MTKAVVLTVGLAADSCEAVTVHNTLETLTFRSTDHVHEGNLSLEDIMKAEVPFLDVVGTSKGKGFQGVVHRHGFAGVGGKTHGQHNRLRHPGSMGASSWPSRVLPGMRMAGHMGNARVKVFNLKVVKILPENNIIVVKGSVPGARGSYVLLEA